MRKLFTMTGALLAISSTAYVLPSHAADATPGDDSGAAQLQEVVVTAQRREQSIQNVPISITAFNNVTIEQAGMSSARDYLQLAPDVSFGDQGQTGNRSISISIRGVSNVNLDENSVANSIGYYIDEFDVGTVASGTINPALLDIADVEVLRGPQGTYFGRNAEGGAINVTTNQPTSKWFLEAAGYGGSFDTDGGRLIVNVPVTSNLFIRAAGAFESSTGTVKNINRNGTPNSGYDQTDARLSALWNISDRFQADASYTYTHDREGLDADVNTGVLEEDTISIEGPTFVPIADGLQFYPKNQSLVDHGLPEWNRNELHMGILRLTYDFGGFTLKSISGDIKTDNHRMFDEDAVSVDTIRRHNEWNAHSYSEELRLQSKPGGALDWVAGVLYARDSTRQFNLVALGTEFSYTYPDGTVVGLAPPFPLLAVNQNIYAYQDKNEAAYGEVTWHPLDEWAFTLGGRYTRDEISDSLSDLVAFGTPQGNLAGAGSFNDFSPRLVATYIISPQARVYGTVSHGYKAGGVDLNAELPQQEKPFDPEKVWNYEVGYKSEFWDRRAMLDASVFYMSWRNVQSQVDYLVTPGDISSAVNVTESAASATSKGVDLQAQVRPIAPLTLSLGIGYLDAKFGSFPGAVIYGNPVDMTGVTLPQAPRWTGSAVAEWRQPILANSSWYLRYEEIYRDRSSANLEGAAAPLLGLPSFPFQLPSYSIGNAHAGVTIGSLSVDGSLWNVFDKAYYTGTADHFGFGGVRVTPHPRLWRLEVIYRTE